MSGNGKAAVTRTARDAGTADPAARARARGLNIGWTVFSYLIGGMIGYGAIGWLVGRAVGVPLLFPIGMLVGLAVSIGYIIYRYGRHGAVEGGDAGDR
jgi:ATP synthase protein I